MERKFGQIIQKGALAATIIGSTLLSQNSDTFKAPLFQSPEATVDYIEMYKVYPPDFEQNKAWYIERAQAIEQAYQILNPAMKQQLRPYFDDGTILENWENFTTDEKSLREMGKNFRSARSGIFDHRILLAEIDEGQAGLRFKKSTASINTRLVQSDTGIEVDYVDFTLFPTGKNLTPLDEFARILDTSKIPPSFIDEKGSAGWFMNTTYQDKPINVSYNIHGFLRVDPNSR